MRQKKTKKRRGIVLITTLSIMTFLVMLGTMVITSGYNSMRRASSFLESELAYHAALTGMVYAQAKLEENMAWMATAGNTRTPSAAEIELVESGQTIIGKIKNSTSSESQFRITFDAGLAPNAYNPPIGYVSSNNLQYDATTETLRWDDASHTYTSFRTVPGQTVSVVVEGLVMDYAGNVRARRVLEASFQRDITSIVDSVAFSANDMNIETADGTWEISQSGLASTADTPPGLRVLGSVTYTSEKLEYFDVGSAQVNIGSEDDGKKAIWKNSQGENTDVLPNVDNVDPAINKSKFPRITFEEAYTGKDGGGSFSSSSSITAGTYVYWEGKDNSGNYELKYYPTLKMEPNNSAVTYDYNDSNQKISVYSNGNLAATYDPEDPPSGTPLDSSSMKLELTANTKVVSVTDGDNNVVNSDLSIVAASSITDKRPQVKLEASSRTASPPVLLNEAGGIYVSGDISGQGSLVVAGDLTFQGHSVLKPTNDLGISLYAKGNVTVKPISIVETGADVLDGEALTEGVLNSAEEALGPNPSVENTDTIVNEIKKSSYYPPGSSQPLMEKGKAVTVDEYLKRYYASNEVPQIIQTIVNKNLMIATSGDEEDEDGKTMLLATTSDMRSTLEVIAGGTTTSLSYQDQTFYGMVYTHSDFSADVGDHSFAINGSLVAYGGDPSSAAPGSTLGKGNIKIKGKNVSFTYDPAYLGALSRLFPTGVGVKKSYWAIY